MTIDQIGIVAAIITAIVAVADSRRQALNALSEQRERFAKIEVKVDTLWAFLLRRAEVEASTQRLADRNSPLTVRPESLQLFESLAPSLRGYYKESGQTLSTFDLALEIEKRFGRQITDSICVPNGLAFGACLLIAVAVATGNPVVNLEV